ncbi:ribokinase-like [Tropilaelaps mercedesae]|uniref:Ribokinase n=1 Tax=Tropilaelaps mercedesae TaxID=418985 RepID=A0A1V9X248_9ACAR|nr:ribokinase-like [Tropilaelaps mercedesae]
MSLPEVIILGGCVTDLSVYTPRFPVAGETLVAHQFQYGFGGKGANTAFMCSRLGLETALISKLGDDLFGQRYAKYLETAGFNADQITTEKGSSSATANITVADSGENAIAYFPGCVDLLSEADIERAESMFRSAKVFGCVFEAPMTTICRALRLAREHGVTTYVNAAPVLATSLPADCLPLIDYLCVNETEGPAVVCQIKGKPPGALSEKEMFDTLLSAGVGNVIMTQGEKGVKYAYEPSKVHAVPAVPVAKVVDTTGAGDAFNGGFIYHLVRNSQLSMHGQLWRACGIASLTVQKKGTQASFPYRYEVPEKFL